MTLLGAGRGIYVQIYTLTMFSSRQSVVFTPATLIEYIKTEQFCS